MLLLDAADSSGTAIAEAPVPQTIWNDGMIDVKGQWKSEEYELKKFKFALTYTPQIRILGDNPILHLYGLWKINI
ncbi:hypothetical protein Pyn_40207 [Prunus yedoensis var. nudiflora]|uniref:Uncharacterized protein n=1 Tax=Prunus yedoensis var. nudiflora TaxID=2094558 RepID=A0A314XUM3_PRUYE|nr:hypothetical protein Pyn_40207 [Prunus yedoensis var. nudiflora]